MDLRIIVGLGNPGRKYRYHRHNIGFRVLDELAKAAGIRWSKRFKAEIGKGEYSGTPVVFAKPQTFMNLSGDAVALLLDRFKVPLESLIVVHDDLDLEKGRVKLKQGGGHGGHNGLRSIIERCGGKEFIRVRIGIGRPEGAEDPAEYVLRNFSDPAEAREGIEKAVEIVEYALLHGLSEAMNRFHS